MTILHALATTGLILAASTGKPAGSAFDMSADGLVDTFVQSCLTYAGREAQMKVWLDAHLQQADEHQTPYFLSGLSGKVWLRSNIKGNYAVIVYDLGLCTVKAEKAPIYDALSGLEQQAVFKLHLNLVRTADDDNGVFQDIAGHIRSYSVQIDGVGYAIIASGTQQAGGPLQSQFTLMLQGTADDDGK